MDDKIICIGAAEKVWIILVSSIGFNINYQTGVVAAEKVCLTSQERTVDSFADGQSFTPTHINHSFLEMHCHLEYYNRQWVLSNDLYGESCPNCS